MHRRMLPYALLFPVLITSTEWMFGQSFIMLGKRFLTARTLETYIMEPQVPGYTYDWTWSNASDSTLIIVDPGKPKTRIWAYPNNKDGTLKCVVRNGPVKIDSSSIYIRMTKGFIDLASLAELDSACAYVFSLSNKCDKNYIDYFELRDIRYERNSCFAGGYQDFTASGITTSLDMGAVYTVILKPNKLLFDLTGDSLMLFYAIWIDYNNDGNFDGPGEAVKFGESNSSTAKLININIANDPAYAGLRRLRVGMRANAAFTQRDACTVIGESGELEDYVVTINEIGALLGPNYLTPNNDGYNDYLTIRGVNPDPNRIRTLSVFTTEGFPVYYEENYDNSWNGTDMNNKPLPPGYYYYIFDNSKTDLPKSRKISSFVQIEY
ncbi:MAG: gliding motility-associated C-terminal domain-containing protein [Cytophagaceae bacterium]|nr:gliding motility-associated C-terminal domain-containing protein [Cytophagaceae bacterium]MDW8456063.1 gliding motility-associated C-terminal domain-containing protein [Cytophagaceae bacterium]